MSILLGSSPTTSIIGYIVMVLGIAYTLYSQGGIPQGTQGWIQFILAVLAGVWGRVQKDAGVSNAPNPLSESKPVS